MAWSAYLSQVKVYGMICVAVYFLVVSACKCFLTSSGIANSTFEDSCVMGEVRCESRFLRSGLRVPVVSWVSARMERERSRGARLVLLAPSSDGKCGVLLTPRILV